MVKVSPTILKRKKGESQIMDVGDPLNMIWSLVMANGSKAWLTKAALINVQILEKSNNLFHIVWD